MKIVERIKKEAKLGDILLTFNRENLLSGAISDVADTDYSHSLIIYKHGKIIESAQSGVAVDELDKYLDYEKYYLSLRRPPLTEAQIKEFIKYCESKLGITYGYWQLFYLWFLYIFKLRNDKRYNNVDLPGIICSELIAGGQKHVGWYPYGDICPANVIPGNLAEHLPVIV